MMLLAISTLHWIIIIGLLVLIVVLWIIRQKQMSQ